MISRIRFTLNGRSAVADVPPAASLQRVLREGFGLTGTKDGCREGECGACTVLFNDEPVDSCLVPAIQVDGGSVVTIEAFGETEGEIHPLLKSFAKHGAVQCGFCTPGFVLSAAGLLQRSPNPTPKEVKEAIEGNLCRCTGYEKIFRAIADVDHFRMVDGRPGTLSGRLPDMDPPDVFRIDNIPDLKSWLTSVDGDIRYLAGATDLMVKKTNGMPVGSLWVDISRCDDLRKIEIVDGVLRIGALVTYEQLSKNELIQKYATALSEAASRVGSRQIRVRATIGGNLGNASPAADGYPPLVSLNATVQTLYQDGYHTYPVEQLMAGPSRTVLKMGELITHVLIPVSSKKRSGFFKSMPRQAQSLSKVSVAMTLEVDDNRILSARVALGAVGPTVIRALDAETLLQGKKLSNIILEEVAEKAVSAAKPIDDFRSDKSYRNRMVHVGTRRLLQTLTQS